jgi:hypothetical protein
MGHAVWPSTLAAALVLTLASWSCAFAGETDGPLTTAQPGAAQAPPDSGDPASTARKIQDFVSSDDEGSALDPGSPAPDRKVHGTVDAWVGNHGTRGVAVQAIMPIGKHGTLGLAFSTGSGPGGYWPGYYGPGDFDSNGYGMRLVRPRGPFDVSGPVQGGPAADCEPAKDLPDPGAAPSGACTAAR